MNLQSYGISGVLDTLSKAELVGLVPYFIDRHPREELVVIGAFGGEPRAWTTWPLPALASGETRRSLARDWAGNEFDQLYLIGYSTRERETAALINQLHTELKAEGLTSVCVKGDLIVHGRQWGYTVYGACVDGYGTPQTVTIPDPATGRVEGLLFRAACRKRYAAARLRPLDPAGAEEATQIAAKCRIGRSSLVDPDRMAGDDVGRYHNALSSPSSLSLFGAVALGIAAAANTGLVAEAMDDILNSERNALEVWSEVARCSTGTERATAAALAALAAWNDRDEAAVAFAEVALDTDAESALAWAIWNLVGTGTAPEHARTSVRADLEAVAR